MTRRRVLGAFAWLILLLIVGAGRFAWLILRIVVWHPRGSLILAGLFVGLTVTNPVVASQIDGALLPEHVVLSSGLFLLGAVTFANGFRSRSVRRLRRQMRRRGW